MKYLNILLLASASFTYAMEQSRDNSIHQTLSEISLIMEKYVPRDVIELTQRTIFKQNEDRVLARYKNKISKAMIFSLGQPQPLPFDANKIKQAAMVSDFVFFLTDDGTTVCHDFNAKESEQLTTKSAFAKSFGCRKGIKVISAYDDTLILCPKSSSSYTCLLLDDRCSCHLIRKDKPSAEQSIKKFIVHKNIFWFSTTNTLYKNYDLEDTTLRSNYWSSFYNKWFRYKITIPVQNNQELLFADNHFILYEATEPGQYTIEVNKITNIDKKMIKTFKVPGTSLALSPDSILFTADNSSLYAHDIVTGELHGSVKHRNLTPQGDGESAKVLCCSRDKLIVAKGPCVFYLSIDPNKFFVFLTGNPK
jgi:hypothetical protein